jgi:hypothetical protein
VRFRATSEGLFRAVQAPMRAAVEGLRCFVSGAGEIEPHQKREVRFAMRNERFRRTRRKSLQSLRALNHEFRGIVCFQRVRCHFVSRLFSNLAPHRGRRQNRLIFDVSPKEERGCAKSGTIRNHSLIF